MYLEDEEIENLYGEFRNEGVAPPPEAKDFVMNSIEGPTYWRYLWIFLLLTGIGISMYFIFPLTESSSFTEDQISENQNPSNLKNDPSDEVLIPKINEKESKSNVYKKEEQGLKLKEEIQEEHNMEVPSYTNPKVIGPDKKLDKKAKKIVSNPISRSQKSDDKKSDNSIVALNKKKESSKIKDDQYG